jgi:hypothetical protein
LLHLFKLQKLFFYIIGNVVNNRLNNVTFFLGNGVTYQTSCLEIWYIFSFSEFSLLPHMPLIDATFSAATVEEIVERLTAAGPTNDLAIRSLDAMKRASPTSLKVALRQIRRGAALPTLADCLCMEFRQGPT